MTECKNGHLGDKYADGRCRACALLRYGRYRAKNRDKILVRAAKARKKNPGYRSPNSRANAASYYEKNKPECLRRSDEYRRKNLSKYAAHRRNRRAREASAEGAHTADDIRDIEQMQRGRCAYCRVKLTRKHVDHIKPISRGGRNDRSNLQILCVPCNVRKAAIDPVEFARGMGRLI